MSGSSHHFTIIDETDDFLIAVKPVGLSVHCDQNIPGFCLQLSQQCNSTLYVVHRLDRMTSGLMIFAKSAVSAARFTALFSTQAVDKFYLALTDKKPKRKQGTVKGSMCKARRGMWRLSPGSDNMAITRLLSTSLLPGLRLFLAKPETGKTHQIRVALKSIGAAIVGDPLYHAQDADRGYLHAWQLRFNYNDQLYCYRSDPIEGQFFLIPQMRDVLENWSEPQSLAWSKN